MQEPHKKQLILIALTAFIFFTGIQTYSWATDGWSAWTAETARRLKIEKQQPFMPVLSAINQDKKVHELFSDTNTIYIVDFIFTDCMTVCTTLGYNFKLMHDMIRDNRLDKIQFLSISFDKNDNSEKLKSYLNRYNADHQNWNAVIIEDRQNLDMLLNKLGVIVIPDKLYGFIHNTAIYLIHNNRVKNIYDHEEYETIVKKIISLNSISPS